MHALSRTVIFVAVLALVGCSEAPREEKGDVGEKGEKGDSGTPGTTLRVVSPQSSTASCQADEIMISAYCTGTFNAYPLVPLVLSEAAPGLLTFGSCVAPIAMRTHS